MKSIASCYEDLLEYCQSIPLVDTHDHTVTLAPRPADPIRMLAGGYFRSDLVSASSEEAVARMEDTAVPWELRWPLFEQAWKRTCHTGYARVLRRALCHFYGVEALTLESVRGLQGRLLDLSDPLVNERILDEANIAVRLEDIWADARLALAGQPVWVPPRGRLVISLPWCHFLRTYEDVAEKGRMVGCSITSLDEYLDACRKIFEAFHCAGAVAFKDQSAYRRSLDFRNPTRAAAEEAFNWILEDPRRSLPYPEGGGRDLSDYLFHCFLRMARDMDLPVQVHTGHMAGIRNDIVKANAIGLTSVIELHRDVRFDLFHANWPYSGEILFLCKNYPNVSIDFCWTNMIDPLYSRNLFQQALSSVPHGKIHAYGSDLNSEADLAWAHAGMARENVAAALADMVSMEYLGLEDAKEVARAWLFDNANQFFRLGLVG